MPAMQRYKLPVFAQSVQLPGSSAPLVASADGWFYPRTFAEEYAMQQQGFFSEARLLKNANGWNWHDRPDPSDFVGQVHLCFDLGQAGAFMRATTDGLWLPVGGRVLLGMLRQPVEQGATVTEDVLWSVTVPGGLLGEYGHIETEAYWSCTANTNSKTFRGAFRDSAGNEGQFIANVCNTATQSGFEAKATWRNVGSSDVQENISPNSGNNATAGAGGSTAYLAAINTQFDNTVEFRGLKAVAADSIVLKAAKVELVLG